MLRRSLSLLDTAPAQANPDDHLSPRNSMSDTDTFAEGLCAATQPPSKLLGGGQYGRPHDEGRDRAGERQKQTGGDEGVLRRPGVNTDRPGTPLRHAALAERAGPAVQTFLGAALTRPLRALLSESCPARVKLAHRGEVAVQETHELSTSSDDHFTRRIFCAVEDRV